MPIITHLLIFAFVQDVCFSLLSLNETASKLRPKSNASREGIRPGLALLQDEIIMVTPTGVTADPKLIRVRDASSFDLSVLAMASTNVVFPPCSHWVRLFSLRSTNFRLLMAGQITRHSKHT